MKRLLISRLVPLLVLLAGAALPAGAATYTQPVTVAFGSALTGQAASVLYTVFDATGAVKIASAGTGVTESTDASGTANTGFYRTALTFDTSWTYPLRVKWTITGQSGVVAEAIIGSDRAAAVMDGYTTALASKANTALPNAAPGAAGGLPTGDGSGRVLLQPSQPGVTIPSVTTLTNAPAFPADYQQRGLAVTLPGAPPAGYGAGSFPTDYARNNAAPSWYTLTGDAFGLLNPLVSAGRFTSAALVNAPVSAVTDTTIQADMIASLIAQGYTITRSAKLDNLDANISGMSARLFAYTLAGTTYGDHVINNSAITWGSSSPTYSGTTQTSPFQIGSTPYVTSIITKDSTGKVLTRTYALANQ